MRKLSEAQTLAPDYLPDLDTLSVCARTGFKTPSPGMPAPNTVFRASADGRSVVWELGEFLCVGSFCAVYRSKGQPDKVIKIDKSGFRRSATENVQAMEMTQHMLRRCANAFLEATEFVAGAAQPFTIQRALTRVMQEEAAGRDPASRPVTFSCEVPAPIAVITAE